MALDPDVVQRIILLWRPFMVLHPAEMIVTLLVVAMVLQKIVLGQFQDYREQDQQFAHDLGMDVPGKMLDFIPVVLDKLRVFAGVLGDELGNVVDFRVVFDPGLDVADAERLVAVITAVLEVGAIFHLLVRRQLEDLLAQAELSVDLFL